MKKEEVNHPDRYNKGGIEVIDIIKAYTKDLNGKEAFNIGNAIKYICRYKDKNGIEDLEKAIFYINDTIEELDPSRKKYSENAEFVAVKLDVYDLLAQLAEEASELSLAALKCSRALKGTNPTPVGVSKAYYDIREEFSDVCNVMKVLNIDKNNDICCDKMQRWFNRVSISEMRNDKKDGN